MPAEIDVEQISKLKSQHGLSLPAKINYIYYFNEFGNKKQSYHRKLNAKLFAVKIDCLGNVEQFDPIKNRARSTKYGRDIEEHKSCYAARTAERVAQATAG